MEIIGIEPMLYACKTYTLPIKLYPPKNYEIIVLLVLEIKLVLNELNEPREFSFFSLNFPIPAN